MHTLDYYYYLILCYLLLLEKLIAHTSSEVNYNIAMQSCELAALRKIYKVQHNDYGLSNRIKFHSCSLRIKFQDKVKSISTIGGIQTNLNSKSVKDTGCVVPACSLE